MSGLPWFRMYGEAVDDDKLRLLAFEDRWHFVAILCCKAQGVLDAHPETLDRRVAVKLGLQLRDADEVKRRLMEVGLVDSDWQPISWEKRQPSSDHDPTNAQRQKRFREKQKEQALQRDAKDNGTVTQSNAVSNASVTALDTDTDTDTDTDNPPPTPPLGGGEGDSGATVHRLDAPDPAFEEAKAAYPRRDGGQNWRQARRAWMARRREGIAADALLQATLAYARHIRRNGKEGTPFVKMAATFYGPDRHFLTDWGGPSTVREAESFSAVGGLIR